MTNTKNRRAVQCVALTFLSVIKTRALVKTTDKSNIIKEFSPLKPKLM
jgi:hypothetical protein